MIIAGLADNCAHKGSVDGGGTTCSIKVRNDVSRWLDQLSTPIVRALKRHLAKLTDARKAGGNYAADNATPVVATLETFGFLSRVPAFAKLLKCNQQEEIRVLRYRPNAARVDGDNL